MANKSKKIKGSPQLGTSTESKAFIKKVILENFLTFEKDEVDFEDAKFTIIIGPNWSGKTTIFQAIKFGLGSNERDTRYTNWSDFIRHFKNHAMVELHIQNDEKIIQLRRTVVRGKSPYFNIKKQGEKEFKKIHAEEVHSLISSLNFNPDNQFAFVSQGNIDAIKSLKPTEVSSYIEEGIGLKGLRTEILEQKEKVETLQNDLKTLGTKRNTLNISLELLRPKIERLKQKKKLLEIKRNYEDELLWANRKQVKQEIKKIEIDIKEIEQKIHEIKTEQLDLTNEIEIFQSKIDQINQTIGQLSERIREKKNRKSELETKIRDWHSEKQTIEKELRELKEKTDKLVKVLKNYESQKKSVNTELKVVFDKKGEIEKRIDDLFDEQEKLKKKIKAHQKFFEEYNSLINLKKDKHEFIKNHKNSIKTIENEIEQIFVSLDEIDHKLDSNKWFLEDPTNNLLKKLDIDLRKTNIKLQQMESEFETLNFEKNKKLKYLKTLRGSLRDRSIPLPSNINILKEEIQNRELRAKGPIIDYLKYDDDLSYAIESVLGEKLLYSFVAEDWDTLDLLKRLKKKFNVYCNIYVPKKQNIKPLPNIKAPGVVGYLADLIQIIGNNLEIKKVIYSKVKNCLVVQDSRTGKDMYNKYNFKGKCVTLKGEQLVSYKYVYEAPYVKRLKGLLSAGTQKEQSTVLEDEISALNDKISEIKVATGKCDKEIREIYGKKEAFHGLQFFYKDKARLTTKKNNLFDEKKAFHGDIEKSENEIKEINEKIEELETQKNSSFFEWNKRIEEIPNELKIINEEKRKWEAKFNEVFESLNEIKEKVNDYKIKLNTVETEYKAKEENFKKADKKAFNIFREMNAVEDEIKDLSEEIDEITQEKKKIHQDKSEFDEKNMQLKLKLEQESVNLTRQSQELESKRSDLSRINLELKNKARIQIRPIDEIKTDIVNIEKRLLEYYDVDDSILVERDDLMNGLKEIAKNQSEIEDEINEAMNTENKMETTYYNRFKTVLETLENNINKKFNDSNIRQHCCLELVGDFKNLGVAVKAAISEKLVRQCTALSGGQVSMISICLILSLQEIKPSALCMLDEAAMFLDDRNAEIAYKLIKSTLQQNSNQMIAFLPQSPTPLFKLADKLIGVARPQDKDSSHVFKEPKIDYIED